MSTFHPPPLPPGSPVTRRREGHRPGDVHAFLERAQRALGQQPPARVGR